jgi:prefoldin subunit 5
MTANEKSKEAKALEELNDAFQLYKDEVQVLQDSSDALLAFSEKMSTENDALKLKISAIEEAVITSGGDHEDLAMVIKSIIC